MNSVVKIGIVAALAVAGGAVIISKRSSAPTANATPVAASPSACCTVAASSLAASTGTPPTTQAVAAAALPWLVDLGAGTCIPCKKMTPILEDLKASMAGKLQVEVIDVRINPEAAKAYAVEIIPTQIFIDATGKELSRHQGFMPREDILARFKEHGIELPAN